MAKTEGFLTLISIGLIVIVIVMALGQKDQKIGDIIVNEAQQRNTISVSDSFTMQVEPDLLELYFSIETRADTALGAQQENTRISDSVIAALKNQGIKNHEIETIGYYLSPEYDWTEGTRDLIGYTQRHSLKVTTQRLDKVGDLIDAATKAGVTDINTVSYTLSREKRDEVIAEALAKAAEKTKVKAQSLATTLGVKLGKVAMVSESNVNYYPYVYAMAEKAAGEAAPTIMPQNLEVTAYISLAYEIE